MAQVTSSTSVQSPTGTHNHHHSHRRGFGRQKTELEFSASTEHDNCVFCRDHEPGRVLIPIHSLKERLFLYVQKALGTHILREQENISVCIAHLQKVLEHRIDDLLEEDLEQLYKLQEEGIKVLGQYELEEENWLQKFDTERTVGEKAADSVARVGGSWRFVLSLLGVLALWMVLNGVIIPSATGKEGWDPFPFILLNLFLSCVAAFQGPIIMMSQNRQDVRDRVVNDYVSKIILRNEHQTRHINAKVDHLLSFQWKRLLEIQEIQTVLMQIQRKGKKTAPVPTSLTGRLSTYRRNSQKSAQYYTFEINPDPFVRMLLRHAFDCDVPEDTLIFSHWHEEGDNFTGILDNVTTKSLRLKLKSFAFDLSFVNHQATLDDILTGENRIVMRNDFNLPHMNFTGNIPCLQLFTNNQAQTYFASELPPRYKPAFALKRNDRITDFWKLPHKRLRITYNPLNQYGIKQIEPGFSLCNVSATFYPLSDTTSAVLYVKELDHPQDLSDPGDKLTDSILRTIVGPRPLDGEWKVLAEVTFRARKEDLSPVVVPIPDLTGPKVFIFLSDSVRVSVHGTLTDSHELFSSPTKTDP